MNLPELITEVELNELLGEEIPPRTYERWRRTGLGPPYLRLGNRIRYRVDDVLVWLARQRRGGPDESHTVGTGSG